VDKSHLERPRSIQIASTLSGVPTFDNATVEQWLSMPPTHETIVQRADTAQVRLTIFILKFLLFFFSF
jgi:hypothetical protein